MLYDNQGRYAEAEPLYKRALAIYEQELGPDYAEVAISLNNLAELYDHQGRARRPSRSTSEALAIYEALGPDQPRQRGNFAE